MQPVTVLHRDDDCIVVDKPSGMIVHRGLADDAVDLLRAVRSIASCRVYPAHRLDRGASGCVVFALHEAAASALGRAFAESRVEKRYVALTRGHPPEEGVVEHPIERVPGGPKVPAVTRYRRLGIAGRYALVEATPVTGRLHQIRRHMKHLSCPLIGDVKYGKGEHNRIFRTEYALHRLALHALELGFPHPRDGAFLTVRAPITGELERCLAALGLLDAVPRGSSSGDPA
jgi:tRNA pseudouridine65 synthase